MAIFNPIYFPTSAYYEFVNIAERERSNDAIVHILETNATDAMTENTVNELWKFSNLHIKKGEGPKCPSDIYFNNTIPIMDMEISAIDDTNTKKNKKSYNI